MTHFGAAKSSSWVIYSFLIQQQNSACLSLETLPVGMESTSLPSQQPCYKTISAHSQTHRKNILLVWLIQSACDTVLLRYLNTTAKWIILSSDHFCKMQQFIKQLPATTTWTCSSHHGLAQVPSPIIIFLQFPNSEPRHSLACSCFHVSSHHRNKLIPNTQLRIGAQQHGLPTPWQSTKFSQYHIKGKNYKLYVTLSHLYALSIFHCKGHS